MKPLPVLRRFVAAGLLAALAVAPAAAGKKKNEYVAYTIVPALGPESGLDGPQKVQIFREGVSAEISYVTGGTRRRMMTATLGIQHDPFATPSGMEPRFYTFLVSMENTSERALFFNPSTSRLLNNDGKVTYAMDYSALYQDLARSTGLTLKQLQQVIYDRSFRLAPGGKARKLLVFERWREKWQEFTLGMTLEVDGMAVVELSAPFRKELLGQDNKKKGKKE
jgi:hypothetical protein